MWALLLAGIIGGLIGASLRDGVRCLWIRWKNREYLKNLTEYYEPYDTIELKRDEEWDRFMEQHMVEMLDAPAEELFVSWKTVKQPETTDG